MVETGPIHDLVLLTSARVLFVAIKKFITPSSFHIERLCNLSKYSMNKKEIKTGFSHHISVGCVSACHLYYK